MGWKKKMLQELVLAGPPSVSTGQDSDRVSGPKETLCQASGTVGYWEFIGQQKKKKKKSRKNKKQNPGGPTWFSSREGRPETYTVLVASLRQRI